MLTCKSKVTHQPAYLFGHLVSTFASSLTPIKHCVLAEFQCFGVCCFVCRIIFVSEFKAKYCYYNNHLTI